MSHEKKLGVKNPLLQNQIQQADSHYYLKQVLFNVFKNQFYLEDMI